MTAGGESITGLGPMSGATYSLPSGSASVATGSMVWPSQIPGAPSCRVSSFSTP